MGTTIHCPNSDNQYDVMVQPLLDIMKVHPGTIDILSSAKDIRETEPFQDVYDVPYHHLCIYNRNYTIENV